MQYAFLIWSLILLLLWFTVFIFNKPFRKEMLLVSLYTILLGLTEPLFVPEYWNPPVLFNLAQRTGFDLESLIFSFAIGGIGSVLYKIVFKSENDPFESVDRNHQKHKLHFYSLFTPVFVFLLLALLTNLNHIYCGIVALISGAVAALFCRPDLKTKIWVGGILFLLLYFVYFELLAVAYPGYVMAVWNFASISGILILGVPLEELLFGFAFGMFWSSVYEHLYWFRVANRIKVIVE
ncbi:MAG: lycopene cyclase domain-containing protein [Sediminibacterium sp.]